LNDKPAARGINFNPGPSYPGVSGGNPILWSKWDSLFLTPLTPHTTLPLPTLLEARYSSAMPIAQGMQILDCTSIGSVSGILNVKLSATRSRSRSAGKGIGGRGTGFRIM
jgi:hypothetical protein